VVRAQDYSRYAPSALALEFTYDLAQVRMTLVATVAMSGITVLKLASNTASNTASDKVQYYCMCATPVDMDVRRYDLIRVLQSNK
jgi:hypothetical protein